MENESLLRRPGAWIPLAMSLTALAFLLGYVAIFGIVQNEDEGAPARIFQIIMLAQLPIAAFFAVKWLPKRPKQSLLVLGLQAVAWITPILAVTWLKPLKAGGAADILGTPAAPAQHDEPPCEPAWLTRT
jgi:hypothetical protein